jgi:small subunit ribosomal protein S3
LGYNKDWRSRWFSSKDYPKNVFEDDKIRTFVKKKLYHAGISRIEIERAANKARLIIYTARPGIVIGRKGVEIEKLKSELGKTFQKDFVIEVNEVRRPETDALLVAENVAMQLERRVAFRRAMKRTMQLATKFGAQGIKISCAGRLGGADIARTEWFREGRVPLHTLRADIDYGYAVARTTYGIIGVKVWIFNGEILDEVASNA